MPSVKGVEENLRFDAARSSRDGSRLAPVTASVETMNFRRLVILRTPVKRSGSIGSGIRVFMR
jgi:hypothetical protein